MRKLLSILAVLALTCGIATAQTATGPKDLGFAYANDYAKYAMHSTSSVSSGAQTVTIRGTAFQTTADGHQFNPLATTIPLYIEAAGGTAETVTPSAVTCTQNSLSDTCTFTATFSYAHNGNFRVTSGTYGLCEAITDTQVVASTGTVVVANGFKGTSATITGGATAGGACDTSDVNVLDTRGGAFQFYVTTGSAYAATSILSAGAVSPDATVTAGVGAPYWFNTQDTTTNWNAVFESTGADTDAAKIAGYKTRSTDANGAAGVAITTGDDLLDISAWGDDGDSFVNTAGITFDSTGTIADTRVGSQIKFYTGTDAAPTVKTLALTIDADQSATFVGQVNADTFNATAGDLTLQTTTSGNIALAPAAAATAAITVAGRLELTKGADVASSTNVTLGGDGNYFHITGSTQIDCIVSTGFTSGSTVTLVFDGSLTFSDAASCTTPNEAILVNGGDFTTGAGDAITLVLDGATGDWKEIARVDFS